MTDATAQNTCTVFADVAGSTRLYETLGDAVALATVERCLGAMKEVTQLNRGRVIKTIGDEIMAVFADAAQGYQAACEMQQRISALPAPAPGIKLAIRIGFHYGSALHDAGDVFGDSVNLAARMAELAKAGQIITTDATVSALPDSLRGSCRMLDALSIKGKADNVRVSEVLWQEGAELTMMCTRLATPPPVLVRLDLRHGTTLHTLSAARPAVSLGRDPACDIAVRDLRASRSHARIELHRDKFVLIDISSNGTYVTFRGESEFALKREETVLRGSGRLVFGHATSPVGGDETVEFTVA